MPYTGSVVLVMLLVLNKYDKFLFIYRTLNHMSINNAVEYTFNSLNVLHMLHNWLN